MQLTPEEIGKKLREFQPAYANAKLGDLELGNAYVKKFGQVDDPSRNEQSPIQTPQVGSYTIPRSGGDNSLASTLVQKYFPKDQWANAMKVMQGESGGRADAVGDNYPIRGQTIPSVGLFQIRTLPGRPSAEQLKDPEFNVKYAADMYKSQGWRPWSFAKKIGLTK